MQLYYKISRNIKFREIFKFLKYLVYKPLITHCTPSVNNKSIRYLEAENWTFKVFNPIKYQNQNINLVINDKTTLTREHQGLKLKINILNSIQNIKIFS